jgi:rubrerythrin
MGRMMRPVRTVEVFYAHALAIEREARDRYAELTTWFTERGEEMLAGLCATLAEAEGAHYRELQRRSRGHELPAIEPSDYQWREVDSPEAPRRELLQRARRPREVLLVALEAERKAAAFFEWVASTSPDAGVRDLGHEMAAEEELHVRWVRDALEYHAA